MSQARAMAFSVNPLLSSPHRTGRSRLLMLFIMLGFVAVAVKAFWLQHVNVSDWQRRAEKMYEKVRDVPATRGRILDRSGVVLASSVPVVTLGVVPANFAKNFEKAPNRTEELAKLAGTTTAELKKRVDAALQLPKNQQFFYLARELPIDVRDRVIGMRLSGVELEVEYRRSYPYEEATAHLVGFAIADTANGEAGQEGLERALDASLRGKEGWRRVVQDSRQNPVEEKNLRKPEPGKDVTLTIDAGIQSAVYNAVKDAYIEHRAVGAAAVVLEASTGEVLAMVNMPAYNPNNRKGLEVESMRNRAVIDSFEPGSTMKPFAIATALQRGIVSTSTVINTAPGKMTINGSTIGDAHTYGALTVAQVIQKSSNVGTAKISLQMPPAVMWQTYHDIGLGQAPQVGFSGTTAGRLRPARSWKEIEQATMSYGHGLSVSLLQLARAYTVFGTDGRAMPVSFVRSNDASPMGERVYSPQVAQSVREMLEAAAAPGGTAPKAQISGYRVGGKTGTAYKAERGGYAKNKYVASFVGLVPIDKPRLVIAVMVDEPRNGKHYGGEVAAPVFAKVAADSMRVMNISPDPMVPAPVGGPAVAESL